MREEDTVARTHTELLELQQLASNDIAFFKNQQWRTANYGLVLYAAIVAVPKLMPRVMSAAEYYCLILAAVVVLVAGLYVLKELEIALSKRRNLIAKLRAHFTRDALMVYGLGNPDEAMKPANEKVSLIYIFVYAYALGFMVSVWLLLAMCDYPKLT